MSQETEEQRLARLDREAGYGVRVRRAGGKTAARAHFLAMQEADIAPPSSAPEVPPKLRLGQIGDRLGFSLTADFLRALGFEPAGRDKAAVLYHESDFPSICAALIRHIGAAQDRRAA